MTFIGTQSEPAGSLPTSLPNTRNQPGEMPGPSPSEFCRSSRRNKNNGFQTGEPPDRGTEAMKEHSIAISASLLFHIIIVVLFLRVPFDQYLRPKLMVLDFSLEKGRGADSAEIVNREPGTIL